MFNFFESIASILSTVVTFVVSFVQGIIDVFVVALRCVFYVIEVLAHLPPFMFVFASGLVSLCIVRFVLNKGE